MVLVIITLNRAFNIEIINHGIDRDTAERKDFRDWLDRVKIIYQTPHKFRHGNSVYSIRKSQDLANLMAVSQNLMHSNLSITDGIYCGVSNKDIEK